jgi:phage shock protein C
MYCTRCGVQLNETAKFCSDCGQATSLNTASSGFGPQPQSRLTRPREDRKIAGVCAGFARYLNIDVTLVRVIAIILVICPPSVGLIAYIVAWIVMPNDPWVAPWKTQPDVAPGAQTS